VKWLCLDKRREVAYMKGRTTTMIICVGQVTAVWHSWRAGEMVCFT